MVIFHSYVSLPEGNPRTPLWNSPVQRNHGGCREFPHFFGTQLGCLIWTGDGINPCGRNAEAWKNATCKGNSPKMVEVFSLVNDHFPTYMGKSWDRTGYSQIAGYDMEIIGTSWGRDGYNTQRYLILGWKWLADPRETTVFFNDFWYIVMRLRLRVGIWGSNGDLYKEIRTGIERGNSAI